MRSVGLHCVGCDGDDLGRPGCGGCHLGQPAAALFQAVRPVSTASTCVGDTQESRDAPKYDGYVRHSEQATNAEIEARHKIAHDLASPVRGTSILADLLAETLVESEPDLDLIRQISTQLTELTVRTSEQLTAFAKELDD